jgi:hypothetical protein
MATTIKAGPEMPSDEYSTPSHVDSCGLFDLDQTKTLQRSNFYAPNVRLGMERTRHLHRLTLSGVEHDYCP